MIRTLTPDQETVLIEKLAEVEHEQWMKWSKALANEISVVLKGLPTASVPGDLVVKLSDGLAQWYSMWVSYDALTEEAKEQNRVWARKVLKIFKELNMEIVSK